MAELYNERACLVARSNVEKLYIDKDKCQQNRSLLPSDNKSERCSKLTPLIINAPYIRIGMTNTQTVYVVTGTCSCIGL